MKYIIFFVALLCFSSAKSQQTFPAGVPTQLIRGWISNWYTVPDSGTVVPPRDTSWRPSKFGMTITWPHAGVDTTQWIWVGNHWIQDGIGKTIDTIPLHNQIVLRLPISDTAAMLLPYLRKADTTNKWVQNVYARNDSLFKQKNGSETFVHVFPTSGGGTVTSVGLSLPSAFNVTPSTITTNGTFAVTGAGTSLQYVRGNGTLATFDTTAIPNFYLKTRSLFSATSPIAYNSTTGIFSLNDIIIAGACNSCNITYNSKGQITSANTGSANVFANHGLFKEVDTIKFGDSIHNNYNVLNYSTGGIAINPSNDASKISYIFGTSITVGYLAGFPIRHPFQYSTLFCNYFGLTERNFGIVGQKIIDFDLATIPHKGDSIKVVVFEFSTNDIRNENGTTVTYGTFVAKYQVMIDTAIARGFSPNDIYMLSAFYFNTDETKANQYNTGIDSLCVLNGTKYIDVYTQLRKYGLPGVAAGFGNCHPDSLTHSVTARVVIDSFARKYNTYLRGQRFIVQGGLTELDSLALRKLKTSFKDPLIILGLDSIGNVTKLPDNWVILNNKRSRNQLIQYLPFEWKQQAANISINGEVAGGYITAVDSSGFNFFSGKTRFSDTVPYSFPTNPPQFHKVHIDSTLAVMSTGYVLDTSYLTCYGWRTYGLTQSNLTSALKKTKGVLIDNKVSFDSYNSSSLFFKTIHGLDVNQWLFANDSVQINGVSTGTGGLAALSGRLLLRKNTGFADTTTFIGGTIPNNGPTAIQAAFDGADGGAGSSSQNIFRGYFSAITAGISTQTNNQYDRFVFVNTGIHGTITAGALNYGYGLYVNSLGTGFTNRYAIYVEGATDSIVSFSPFRLPNISAKADTTNYKPVVVDATGNIFKMTGWPRGSGVFLNPQAVTITGNVSSGSAPGVGGTQLLINSFTYTNTAAAGTETNGQNFSLWDQPTLTSGNAISYTGDVATVRFVGAPVAAGSTTISHPWNIYANDVNRFAGVAMAINEQSGAITLSTATHNIYTGTGDTWTLPALSTWPGLTYFIKNAGSGNLVVQRAGSDNIYNTSSVTSVTVAAGASIILVAGSFWYVE